MQKNQIILFVAVHLAILVGHTGGSCLEYVTVFGNDFDQPYGVLGSNASAYCEFHCTTSDCQDLINLIWRIDGTSVYTYNKHDANFTGPVKGTVYEHYLDGKEEGNHRHVLFINETTCNFYKELECMIETGNCIKGVKHKKQLAVFQSPSKMLMSVTGTFEDSKLHRHILGCSVTSNPNSTVSIKVGKNVYSDSICAPTGKCGEYECSTTSAPITDEQVSQQTNISCTVIYHSAIGEDVTIETDYSSIHVSAPVMKEHGIRTTASLINYILAVALCIVTFLLIIVVLRSYLHKRSVQRSTSQPPYPEVFVNKVSPDFIKQSMKYKLDFPVTSWLGMGKNGVIVLEKKKSPMDLHMIKWDNGFKEVWNKPKPKGTDALCLKSVTENDSIYLSTEGRQNHALFSESLESTSSHHGCLISCLSHGKLAYKEYLAGGNFVVKIKSPGMNEKQPICLKPFSQGVSATMTGLCVCDDPDTGRLAMTETVTRKLNIYEKNGELISSIELPWTPNWNNAVTNVDGKCIAVAKSHDPPELSLYTWSGDSIAHFTSLNLELDEKDWVNALKYMSEGFLHVGVGNDELTVLTIYTYKLALGELSKFTTPSDLNHNHTEQDGETEETTSLV